MDAKLVMCWDCKQEKPPDQFGPYELQQPGKNKLCRMCKSRRHRQYSTWRKKYRKDKYHADLAHRHSQRYQAILGRDRRYHQPTCTKEEYLEIVMTSKCFYCDYDGVVGVDRIDNALGHTTDNLVSCCYECNIARSDNFTMQEMRDFIGPAIKKIREQRDRNGLPKAHNIRRPVHSKVRGV